MRCATFFVADLFHFRHRPFSILSLMRDLFVADLLSLTFSIYVADLFHFSSLVFFSFCSLVFLCCNNLIMEFPLTS